MHSWLLLIASLWAFDVRTAAMSDTGIGAQMAAAASAA